MSVLDYETMGQEDYPIFYRIADSISIEQQKKYFLLLFLNLLLLILGASLTIFENNRIINVLTLVLFVISFLFLWISNKLNPLDLWYNGRAVAESVKSMTWKWMMKAKPYTSEVLQDSCENLRTDFQTLMKQNRTIFGHFNYEEDPGFYSITEKMRNIRESDIEDRIIFYSKNRIQNQLGWYQTKVNRFTKIYKYLFFVVISFYVVITILMILSIVNPNRIFPIEILSTLVASFISWMEAKKYNELSSAYKLAIDDIKLVESSLKDVGRTEKEFTEFVVNSENAFSREHTQWIARKN